jgi:hypothetical protein
MNYLCKGISAAQRTPYHIGNAALFADLQPRLYGGDEP